jgi:hypothetical protein
MGTVLLHPAVVWNLFLVAFALVILTELVRPYWSMGDE